MYDDDERYVIYWNGNTGVFACVPEDMSPVTTNESYIDIVNLAENRESALNRCVRLNQQHIQDLKTIIGKDQQAAYELKKKRLEKLRLTSNQGKLF